MSIPSYISAGTLAYLSTLTNIGSEADILTNSHCPSNYTSVNSSQYGTVYSSNLTTVNSSNYNPVNSSQCDTNNTSVNTTVNASKYVPVYNTRCSTYCYTRTIYNP